MPSPTMIVCAVDGSGRAHHVARVSRQLAEAADARVVLTHVFDPMMVPAPPTRELDLSLSTEDIEQHERRLARHALARTAESLGDVAYAAVFAEGRPESEILGVVDDYDARLLVTGSAALTPVERIMGGSLSAQLAVAARCPVVVVTDDAAMCSCTSRRLTSLARRRMRHSLVRCMRPPAPARMRRVAPRSVST